MKPTQKNQNDKKRSAPKKKNEWQIPERTQVIITPGAARSIEEAQSRGVAPKIKSDRPPVIRQKKAGRPQMQANSQPVVRQGSPKPSEAQSKSPKNVPQNKEQTAPPTLKEAVVAELRDRIRTLRLSIQVNSEDIIKGCICSFLLIFFALFQTTFFHRFAPFGKVPDLMLIFVLAIGVYEGEKWGSVAGLAAAFIIQALGSSGTGPELLSLLYMPAGCMSGLLSKYYLRHTFPVNATYILIVTVIKEIFTVISAMATINAEFADIITKIAVPEYFSTVLISPFPFISVWIVFKIFHKTRAQRTDSIVG